MEVIILQLEEDERNVKIENAKNFRHALDILLNDPNFPEENIKTKSFLEAMQAKLETIEGRESSFLSDLCDYHITWSDLFTLLQASAAYE